MSDRAPFGRQEVWALCLMGLSTLFLFADQNLLAPNLTAVAREFGMTDLERDVKLGGNIAFVFWILGGVVTLGIGWLTDRLSRKALYVGVLLVGAIPCLLTGFARSYTELFWLRALTGIGIGGALPLCYSLIGDYFSARNRASASAVLGFMMGLGIAVGQLLAGFLGPTHGWRLPFTLVALPNLLIAPLFFLTVREPVRGQTEQALRQLIESGQVYTGRIDWSRYKSLFRIRTNLLVFLQGIPGTVPWGVFFVYLNDYYSQEKGYSVEVATLIVMMVGGAAILGGLGGGLVGNRLYNLHPRYLPLLCGTTTLLGILPMAALLNWPSQVGVESPSSVGPLVLGFVTGFTITITGPNVKAMLLNVNAPETRGSIFSLFNLADDLGKGFGPVIISALIVAFGRQVAFNVANLFWVFCGIVLLLLVRAFPRDEAALQEKLRSGVAAT